MISRIEAGQVQPDAFLYSRLAGAFGLSVESLHRTVEDAMGAAKRAANAVGDGKNSWDEIVSGVGLLVLAGLIVFAVVALIDGGKRPRPKI